MHASDHLEDETLSALVDEQLAADAAEAARAHLETCAECQERLEGFRSVAGLLRELPEITPPRDFKLGPRLADVGADPPNVVRLQRWYTATRTAAAALAAMFVLLSAGTLYVDSQRTPPSQLASAARPAVAPASGAASSGAAPPATVGARAAAQPAVSAASPVAPAAPAAARPAPQTNPQADDQQAASTSVSALPPTPVPTPVPTAIPAPVSAAPATAPLDQAAPLRTAAVAVGVFAVLALLLALIVRHRLRHAPSTI